MAGDAQIAIVGNLTTDLELRLTPGDQAVVDFIAASTPRQCDSKSGQWHDGNTLFMRCSAWNDLAENIGETLRKGMHVIVRSNLVQRSYETKDGQSHTVIELRIEEVGPSFRWTRAQVSRSERFDQGRGGYQGGNHGGTPAGGSYGGSSAGCGAPAGGTVDDPWRASSQGDAAFDEPPF